MSADMILSQQGLEALILYAKFLSETHDERAPEVMRECTVLTKRDKEVPGDTAEDIFSRLDSLYQLLMTAQQPEMAMGVAKERVAMVPGRKAQDPAPGEGSSYERTRGKDDGTLEGEVPAVVKPDPRQQKVSHPPTLEIDGLAFERDGRRR